MFLSTIINSDSHPLYLFVFLKRRRGKPLLNLYIMREVCTSPPVKAFLIIIQLSIIVICSLSVFVLGSWIQELQEGASDENPAGIYRCRGYQISLYIEFVKV